MSLSSIPPSDPAPRAEPVRLPQPARSPEAAAARDARRDQLDLSDAARELAAAAQAAAGADADRAELVLEIRRQIAEGSYEPDAEAVARALLERLEG